MNFEDQQKELVGNGYVLLIKRVGKDGFDKNGKESFSECWGRFQIKSEFDTLGTCDFPDEFTAADDLLHKREIDHERIDNADEYENDEYDEVAYIEEIYVKADDKSRFETLWADTYKTAKVTIASYSPRSQIMQDFLEKLDALCDEYNADLDYGGASIIR